MCVCVYVCVRACACMCACVRVCACIITYTSVCVLYHMSLFISYEYPFKNIHRTFSTTYSAAPTT